MVAAVWLLHCYSIYCTFNCFIQSLISCTISQFIINGEAHDVLQSRRKCHREQSGIAFCVPFYTFCLLPWRFPFHAEISGPCPRNALIQRNNRLSHPLYGGFPHSVSSQPILSHNRVRIFFIFFTECCQLFKFLLG